MSTIQRIPGLAVEHLKEPWWKWETPPYETVILQEEGKSLGCLRLFERKLLTGACSLDVIGIGGVYVIEENRGSGIATYLLEATLKFLEGKYAMSVLFSQPRTLYRTQGFQAMGEGLWGRSLSPGLRAVRGRWMLLPEEKF